MNEETIQLKKRIEELEDIIDKGLEYIETMEYNESYGKKYVDYHELIEILKGE